MSGLWSFREPNLTLSGTTGEPRGVCCTSRVVTQVLPTGVEYQKSLLSDCSETGLTMSATPIASKTTVLRQCNSAACPHETTHSHCNDNVKADNTANASHLLCVQSHVAENSAGAGLADVDHGVVTADSVDRDEAVREVQRNWWRTFNVDVTPAVDLNSCTLSSAGAAPAELDEADEAAREAAHELLARIASSENEVLNDAISTGTNSMDINNGKHMPLSKVRRIAEGCASAHEKQKGKCHEQHTKLRAPAAPSPRFAAPRKATAQKSEYSAQQREQIGHAVNATTSESEQLHESISSLSRNCGMTAKVLHRAFASLSLPRLEIAGSTERSSQPLHAAASDKNEGSVHLELDPYRSRMETEAQSTAPSKALKKAMGSVSVARAPTTVCPAAGGGVDNLTCMEKGARVVLRHYYILWFAAAEERRIQRSAASYHQYLLQCVRDALGQTSKSF